MRKSGLALGFGFGRKLYLPTFLRLYPTTTGVNCGVLGLVVESKCREYH